ncbi:hypothetical protein [Corynebacterium sp. ED61]|uniref:hypothetical protein n=1 Tax=Corynebacterium sp. ED61 TaxID=2211360 RepID=UPI0018841F29|nr:hypothetical protein [Corynebacterium sp. ED61]MBF0580791.1 hypothetical protein [Corynebacterium sp. ED61]
MREVSFENLLRTEHEIRLDVLIGTQKESLWFEFSEPAPLSNSNLAHALAAIVGTHFDHIRFDFPIASQDQEHIELWTKSRVHTVGHLQDRQSQQLEDSAVLNFSGGFDSLSALALLPEDTELVSLDFGGRFSREREFFRLFDPKIVSTNLAQTSLRRFSWSFMGIGPLLYRDSVKSRYFAFGSIYEASGFKLNEPTKKNFTFPAFSGVGYESAMPVAGISEIGTAQIILNESPEIVEHSLRSLASPGEEKYFRKIAIVQTVADRLGIDVTVPPMDFEQKVHYEFGESFAVDVTALYLLSEGRGYLADKLVKEIPGVLKREALNTDMTFLQRVNPHHYSSYPSVLSGGLIEGMQRAGLRWYKENDFENLKKFKYLTRDYYAY